MVSILSLFFILISCSSCFSAVVTPRLPTYESDQEFREVIATFSSNVFEGYDPETKREICEEIMTSTYFTHDLEFKYVEKTERILEELHALSDQLYADHVNSIGTDAYKITNKQPYYSPTNYKFTSELSVFGCLARGNSGSLVEVFVSYGYKDMMFAEDTFLLFHRMAPEVDWDVDMAKEGEEQEFSDKLDFIGIAEGKGNPRRANLAVLENKLYKEFQQYEFLRQLQTISAYRLTRICKVAYDTLYDNVDLESIRARPVLCSKILVHIIQTKLEAPVIRCEEGPRGGRNYLYLTPSLSMGQRLARGAYILKHGSENSLFELTDRYIRNIAPLNKGYLQSS